MFLSLTPEHIPEEHTVNTQLTINGNSRTLSAPRDADLATALRNAGYTGVKCGCDGGDCGASKVLIDGEAEMACGTTVADVEGSEIVTIEGLGTQRDLHPIQQAFVDHFAVQCGFCTPGMIIQAVELLEEEPSPSEEQIRNALSDNHCRCTGYQKPVEAIQDAAERLRDDPTAVADGGLTETNGESTRRRTDEPSESGRARGE